MMIIRVLLNTLLDKINTSHSYAHKNLPQIKHLTMS